MSMFVYKGERGLKNALNSAYVVCTQSPWVGAGEGVDLTPELNLLYNMKKTFINNNFGQNFLWIL